MNYTFPIINNISDVLPHIKGYEEIIVTDKGDYTVIKYMVSTPEIWERTSGWEYRRECRGLIFDSKTGKIIARPYAKFFNINEKPETQSNLINLYEPHVVLEKLDGSLVFSFKVNNELKIATKAGETEVSAMAANWLKDHQEYYDFMNYVIDDHESTPLFEFCSRKNRIVIDYPEDRLVLTAIRDNKTGKYWRYDDLVYYANLYGIECVKAVDTLAKQNINLFVDQVKEWEGSEGIVIRFENGHMAKVKADDYIAKHYAKEAINQEKNLIKLILDENLDDLLPTLYDEDRERVLSFEEAFHEKIYDTFMSIHDMYGEYVGDGSQKDFAVNYALKKDKKYQSFLFKLHRNEGDYSLLKDLYDYIGKHLGSSSQVDSVRWVFGGLSFINNEK